MTRVTTLDAAGEMLIARFEGGRSADGLYRAYWDPWGKIWTIGVGETIGVRPGMVWTATQAFEDLRRRFASSYAWAINDLGADLNQNQFNALASFVWNEGPGSMAWDIGRQVRAENFTAAADAFLHYSAAGGNPTLLLSRRQQERAVFLTAPAPPPIPPDPHGYLKFDTTDRDLGHHRRGNERQLVQEYDVERARWLKFPGRLRVLRDDMDFLAARLANMMRDDPATNDVNHRQWRHDQLAGRAAGKRFA